MGYVHWSENLFWIEFILLKLKTENWKYCSMYSNNNTTIVELGLCIVKWKLILNRTYFTETENWKYYSKIIFKCVNNIVGPILIKKWLKFDVCGIREQCTDALFTADLVNNYSWKRKKKKRRKRRLKTQTSFQYYPNRTLDLGRVRVVLYYYVL